MENYLGETVVDIKDTKFENFSKADWSLYFIERYGQIDGDHHKQWVLDQVARILMGTDVIVKLARWKNGTEEYRVTLDIPSEEYENWVLDMRGEYDYDEDVYEYSYDEGIAP